MSVNQTYVSLHTHSQHSFLDGFSSVEDIARRASDIGMTAVAITDHGEVSGHLQFQQACEKHEVKPIFGIEAYVVNGTVESKREEKSQDRSHLCMFAETQTGLKNIWALSSKAYKDGFYYKPLLQWDWLKENHEGIIATDGCLLAYMAKYILAGQEDRAAQLVGTYVDTFGEDNFFMELHTWQFLDPQTESERKLNQDMSKVNKGKVRIAQKFGIPLIVVNDAHYANSEDWKNHALVWNINTKNKDDKTESGQTASWIMTDEEVIDSMSRHGIPASVTQEAIENTARIAARCTVTIPKGNHLPTVTGSVEGDSELFQRLVEEGYQRKIIDKGLDGPEYRDRLNMEIQQILDKNFAGYFCKVSEYTTYAKNKMNMLVGPARGSGAGSLAAYCMSITEIDPVKYGLMFGRFITPGRVELPDIDLDFQQSRRQELISYLRDSNGDDNVCAVGTLSRSGASAALKDLARAMGISYNDSNEMTKIIDSVAPSSEASEDEEEVTYEDLINKAGGALTPWLAKYQELFQRLNRFIGNIRQSGVHASGLIISDSALTGNLPTRIKKDSGQMVSQFENSETQGSADLAYLGYVKYDILGLRHLDTLEEARQMIFKRHGKWLDYYNFDDNELDDPKVYEPVSRGETTGLFQIESSLGTQTCKRLEPEGIRDIAIAVSIGRPGVIDAGMYDEYLDRRNGMKEIRTPHPIMDRVLEETYGICVYQEQVIELVQELANYSLEEADGIRKIMGKKLKDKMKDAKAEFISRCLKNKEFLKGCKGSPENVALRCWNNIEPSAGYSFGKGHAHGYAFITAWEAWVKYYYPEEFYTALLRTDAKDANRVARYISEARGRKFKILPPDINESDEKFTLTNDGIRYGITSVAGIGPSSYEEIRDRRPFSSLEEVLSKMSKRNFSSAVGTKLISIGALDRFGTREALLAKFFLDRKIKDKSIPDFSDDDYIADMEKELVGTFITKDPMARYAKVIEDECVQTSYEVDQADDGDLLYIGGSITRVLVHKTKTGDLMAFLAIEWRGDTFETVVFPKKYSAYKQFLVTGKPVICQVEKTDRGCTLRDLFRLDKLGKHD